MFLVFAALIFKFVYGLYLSCLYVYTPDAIEPEPDADRLRSGFMRAIYSSTDQNP
jgi:hypothetical protein